MLRSHYDMKFWTGFRSELTAVDDGQSGDDADRDRGDPGDSSGEDSIGGLGYGGYAGDLTGTMIGGTPGASERGTARFGIDGPVVDAPDHGAATPEAPLGKVQVGARPKLLSSA